MKKTFRTIETSEPDFEHDGLKWITVKSVNLRGRGNVIIYQPPQRIYQPLPVIIFLHGVYGSSWSWPFKSGVHLQVKEMIKKKIIPPVMLVFPSDGLWGDGSGYVPHNGFNFEKWITEDIPALLRQQFRQVTDTSKFFITGLSMGGFGALRIGAKNPHIFSGFSGHSSLTEIKQMKLFVEEPVENYLQKDEQENSLLKTILACRDSLQPFRFDCGKNDKLFPANRKLHLQLEKAGIPHDFEELEGSHEWPYWEKNISRSILFFMNE